MPPKLTKTIIGAVIAVALAAAVSYGLISQQTADKIQTQANQSLQDDQASPAPGLAGRLRDRVLGRRRRRSGFEPRRTAL